MARRPPRPSAKRCPTAGFGSRTITTNPATPRRGAIGRCGNTPAMAFAIFPTAPTQRALRIFVRLNATCFAGVPRPRPRSGRNTVGTPLSERGLTACHQISAKALDQRAAGADRGFVGSRRGLKQLDRFLRGGDGLFLIAHLGENLRLLVLHEIGFGILFDRMIDPL